MASLTAQDLLDALNGQQLRLHYQPQFDLFRQSVTGVEALVRWQHPRLGLLPPDRFIPLAEASGLIVPLGSWVLSEACRQAAEWRRAGRMVTIGVNVSVRQMGAATGFLDVLRQSLEESGLPPEQLQLEVTESILMDEQALSLLSKLRDTGVSLAIDDFGAGYSSLSYLKRFPASTLKIDKGFMDSLPASLADCMLVDGITRLAHSFGMQVLAEGVEHQEQIDVLTGWAATCCKAMPSAGRYRRTD